MTTDNENLTAWYEVQQNTETIENPNFIIFQRFPYDTNSDDSQIRLKARRDAIKYLRSNEAWHNYKLRIIHTTVVELPKLRNQKIKELRNQQTSEHR